MNIQKHAAHFDIHLTPGEAIVLRHVLNLYPLLNPDYQRLSQKPDARIASGQKLLEEAMAEQHRLIKSELNTLLESFDDTQPGGISARAAPEQLERLLQALNDVRVGCWVKLGKPDLEERSSLAAQAHEAPLWNVMEVSGYLQMEILKVMRKS